MVINMTKIFKRSMIIFTILLILMLSCSIASATSNMDDDVSINTNNVDLNEIEENDLNIETKEIQYDKNPTDLKSTDEKIKTEPKIITVSGNSSQDIQNAIESAEDGDTIELNGTYTGHFDVYTEYGFVINKEVTIIGNEETYLNLEDLITISSNNVILKNLMFASNNSDSQINILGKNCNIVNCKFSNFYKEYGYPYSYYGNAIKWDGKNGTIINCVFENCTAPYKLPPYYDDTDLTYSEGGAILWNSDNGQIINSSFINCSSNNGGAISINGNNNTLYNCIFENSRQGSAISIEGKNNTISDSYFKDNHGYSGGSIDCSNPYENRKYNGDNNIISNCSFINSSATYGGAIYFFGNTSIINCSFLDSDIKDVTRYASDPFEVINGFDGKDIYGYGDLTLINSYINPYNFSSVVWDYDKFSKYLGDAELNVINLTQDQYHSFRELESLIDNSSNKLILENDYYYIIGDDVHGININKNISIYGGGHILNGLDKCCIFNVTEGSSLEIYNISFQQSNIAIYNKGKINVSNSNFIGDSNESVNDDEIPIYSTNEAYLNNCSVSKKISVSDIKYDGTGFVPLRTSTKLIYKNMTTIAVSKADGRIGEYFNVYLKDAHGKALANKTV